MKKRAFFIFPAAVVLTLLVGLFALLNSQSGSRWLLRQSFALLPAKVVVGAIEGRLTQRLTLTGFDYRSDSIHIKVDNFVFAWKPSRLFRGTLHVTELAADILDIDIEPVEEPAPKEPFSLDDLPRLPLDVFIDRVLLTGLSFRQPGTEQHIDMLQFSVLTENDRLKIPELTLNAEAASLTAGGEITLRGEVAFLLTAGLQADTAEYGAWRVEARIHGDARQIDLAAETASPFGLELNGSVKDWQKTPHLDLKAAWRKLSWPLAGQPPQIVSDQGRAEISGSLDDYRISLRGELSTEALPKALLTLDGKGSTQALAIEALELKSGDGLLRAEGRAAWQPETAFDLALSARDFDPAILLPDMPGRLALDVRAKGILDGNRWLLEAGIDKLSGSLRGRPLNGGGKLALKDEVLDVDSLYLASGANKISLDGSLGTRRSLLDVVIEAPDLHALWPTLGGNFRSNAQLLGAWRHPSIKLRGEGKSLRFAEHGVGRLNLDLDYKAAAAETSKIALSARTVNSGGLQIDRLSLEGSGAGQQHRLEARIDSPHTEMSAALEGGLHADSWEGRLARLDIRRSGDDAQWRLAKPWPMRAQKEPEGIAWILDSGCLQEKSSSICLEGHYRANGDFKAKAHVANFPTDLFRDYFPEGFGLAGLIDADADLRGRKDALTGQYAVSLPGRTMVRMPARQKTVEITLGPGSLSGELKDKEITAVADLKLVGQDYLQGRLRLNTGKPQTLSGQINASVRRLDLIAPFVPQLSDIRGHLRADLGIEGTLQKPGIAGMLDLSEGAIEMAGIGYGLQEIDLRAVASGKQETRVRLEGTAQLAALSHHGPAGQTPVRERVKVNADARFREKTVAAELDLALGARNRVAAQLRMDNDRKKTLSGRVTASLTDWKLLDPLIAPQLSKLQGKLSADIGIGGTPDKPEVDGSLNLAGGAVDLETAGIAVRAIELQAIAAGDTDKPIRISGSARSGQGSIDLNGFADPAGTAELHLSGSDFEAVKLPEAQVAVSPDLLLEMALEQRKISGSLKIPKAAVELKELPENAVAVSKDEVILGEEKAKQKAAPPIPIDADIEVELGKQVTFSGFGLKTDLAGKLRISQSAGKTAAHGDIDMKKARYKSYGQDLTVQRGKIIFNGPLDNPWLDVEAVRVSKDEKTTAILNLSGPLTAPKTRLSSKPPLPESDVLAYLVTGGPLAQVSQAEGNVIASAALAYGSSRVAWIANKFGLSEFEVKEGKTLQDTLVQAGRYLTPNFYVGAKVGLFNNQAALVMKRKLSEKFNLETEAGTSQRVKINYEFDTD